MAPVTMSDVARAAGVSVMTVSNVINGRPRVGAETRLRVLEVVADLGYEVNLSAKRLRAGKSGTVGLVVAQLDHLYFGELAARFASAFARQGIHVVVEQSGASPEGELSAISHARLQMYDGVLLSVVGLTDREVDRLHPNVPLVLLGEQEMPSQFDHLSMANVDGARMATGHLLDHGCRRVAIVGGAPPGECKGMARLRSEGWRQAHTERGLVADDRLVLDLPLQESHQARARVAAALAAGLEIDGVFAVTDQDALGVLVALHDAGLSVPEDVPVIGFDNLAVGELFGLTTIDPDNGWIVDQAVRLLEQRMAGRSPEPEHLLSPVRLVERRTTR